MPVRESSNFFGFQEIRVEEHECDVRFWTGSGNVAVSSMHNASAHRNTLWTWLRGRYHVPQNLFLVSIPTIRRVQMENIPHVLEA